jgi:hypothetical protein
MGQKYKNKNQALQSLVIVPSSALLSSTHLSQLN